VVIDIFPDGKMVAGSPFHVAAHLATLGWKAYLVTRVGDDEDGRVVRSALEERGIETALVETDEVHATGTVTVSLSDAGHSFVIHSPASWDFIGGPDALPEHEILCFGTLAGRRSRSFSTLKRMLEASTAPKALDVNLREDDDVLPAVVLGLEHATIVKAGGEEFDGVAGMVGVEASPRACFDRYPRLQWLAITYGASGAELHHRDGGAWRHTPDPVPVVDSVGAGDAFFAGMVDAIAAGEEGELVLRSAEELAVNTVQQRGGSPSRRG
jgi:fructokinase